MAERRIGRQTFIDGMYFRCVNIFCCIDGAFGFTVDEDRRMELSAGEYFFVHPGHFVSIEGLGENNRIAYVLLGGEHAENYVCNFGFFDLFACRANPQYGSFLEFKRMVENGAAHDASHSFLNNLLETVRASACRNGIEAQFLDVVASIRRDLVSGGVKISRICREFAISRSHLYSLFKRNGVDTPGDFIRRQQLRLAVNLLVGTDHSVGKIAKICGFSSPAYFSIFFRRHLKTSPGGFRRRGHSGCAGVKMAERNRRSVDDL